MLAVPALLVVGLSAGIIRSARRRKNA
jgi:hypothetical protein